MTSAARPRPARYRLYIDESGDHAYSLLDDPAHRYLALLGVWFGQESYNAFADDLDRFKRDIWGPRPDKPVILHRTEIINRKGTFGALRESDVRAKFDGGLLDLIARAQFKRACVLIDKQAHLDRYSSPFHPYHYCLAAMLDRYSGRLNFKNAVGDVTAESRGGEEDLQLKQAYRRAYESGTLMFRHEHHQRALTSQDIKIQPRSANIPGLQLADVLAHPVKQSCLAEKGRVPPMGNVFGKKVLQAVAGKFSCCEGTGRVEGYGKVYLWK
jgi:hypothetical protein